MAEPDDPERRVDPTCPHGIAYTRAEFLDFYGSLEWWDSAPRAGDPRRGRWSEHEDTVLRGLVVQEAGRPRWTLIAQSLQSRNGKQARSSSPPGSVPSFPLRHTPIA